MSELSEDLPCLIRQETNILGFENVDLGNEYTSEPENSLFMWNLQTKLSKSLTEI